MESIRRRNLIKYQLARSCTIQPANRSDGARTISMSSSSLITMDEALSEAFLELVQISYV